MEACALPIAAGRWARASGTIVEGPSGYALHVAAWHRVPAPRDPFVYR
ncbi:MAG: hypothetical protein ACREM2_11640 [Vulcanimicrobiaceae bacterium]